MATYVVGDVQGCYDPLCRLLDKIRFDQSQDTLVSVGDLINRGPDNLGVVRLVFSLGSSFRLVLGNHDLNFLAVHAGLRRAKPKDTTSDLLSSELAEDIVAWYRVQPLALWVEEHLVVHAGLVPDWTKELALQCSSEVSITLRGPHYRDFLHQMYGDQPDRWDESLTGIARLRVITNVLTRLRFCAPDGRMDLENKLAPQYAPSGMAPWFSHGQRAAASTPIVFGHWAALEGQCTTPNVFAVDSGCVWGRSLTCIRLEDHRRFETPCNP
jgi:bis(5'-nucleosyl)-tetraphosphatase (symmetrical)